MATLYLIKIGIKPNFQKRIERGENVENVLNDILALRQTYGAQNEDGYSIFSRLGNHIAMFNPFYFGAKLADLLNFYCESTYKPENKIYALSDFKDEIECALEAFRSSLTE